MVIIIAVSKSINMKFRQATKEDLFIGNLVMVQYINEPHCFEKFNDRFLSYVLIGEKRIYGIIKIEKIEGEKINFGSFCHYNSLVVVEDREIIHNWTLYRKLWDKEAEKNPFERGNADDEVNWSCYIDKKVRPKFLKALENTYNNKVIIEKI